MVKIMEPRMGPIMATLNDPNDGDKTATKKTTTKMKQQPRHVNDQNVTTTKI